MLMWLEARTESKCVIVSAVKAGEGCLGMEMEQLVHSHFEVQCRVRWRIHLPEFISGTVSLQLPHPWGVSTECVFNLVCQNKWTSFSTLTLCLIVLLVFHLWQSEEPLPVPISSIYLLALDKGQEFSHRNFYVSLWFCLTKRSASTCFVVVQRCNITVTPLSSSMLMHCVPREDLIHWCLTGYLHKGPHRVDEVEFFFGPNNVVSFMSASASCILFPPTFKFTFQVYSCLLSETLKTTPQLSLRRAAVVLFHCPPQMRLHAGKAANCRIALQNPCL